MCILYKSIFCCFILYILGLYCYIGNVLKILVLCKKEIFCIIYRYFGFFCKFMEFILLIIYLLEKCNIYFC